MYGTVVKGSRASLRGKLQKANRANHRLQCFYSFFHSSAMSSVCQYPYVNVFKQFGVGQWKKCCKEGDVTPVMDRDIKATVYRISGAILSGNYIQFPKVTSQSLGLTGHFIYLLFRPLPTKYFSIHFELATDAGLAVRLSLSNLFKEFKSTSTWLQFPFSLLATEAEPQDAVVVQGGKTQRKNEKHTPKFSQKHRWTLLVLDLRAILTQHLNANFAYVKNIQLCANILVKGVFVSHTEYCPVAGDSIGPGGTQPLPRDMRLPLGKSEVFADIYNYVRFPFACGGVQGQIGCVESLRKTGPANRPSVMEVKSVNGESGKSEKVVKRRRVEGSSGVRSAKTRGSKTSVVREGGKGGGSEDGSVGSGVHVYAECGGEVNLVREESSCDEENDVAEPAIGSRSARKVFTTRPCIPLVQSKTPALRSLQPDPIMKLNRVIGFGGHCTSQVLFPCQGCVVYPCHSLVVITHLQSGDQRFLVGHTNKVSCLAVSGDGCVLASGQTGSCASVRVWDFESGQCLALFQTHSHSLSSLSFSNPGSLLCGVGRDRHGKTHVVLWHTSSLRPAASGEVTILAQAHTDVSIHNMKIAHFDDKRMVSCGRDNVRFWRVKSGTLRSCPVNFDSRHHHHLHFTDVAFQPGYPSGSDIYHRNVYACTRSGHVFEIHYQRVSVGRVWHLLPGNGSGGEGGVAITALCLHEAFSVTGSEDGTLRVWPTDFSSVFLEAEHEASVTAVGISDDGMTILAATASGNIGILDAASHSYATKMRSHRQSICSACLDSQGLSLVTCSSDNTIRVWNTHSGEQMFDFRSVSERPLCVSHHPTQQVFVCGFSSGTVSVFHTHTTSLLAEHRQHHGEVRSVLFSTSGHRLYSCCSSGSLAMYDSEQQTCPLLRLVGNVVVKGEGLRQQSLALSEDGQRLACVGPLQCNVTILDAPSLSEVLRLDITPMVPSTHTISSAQLIIFSSTALDHLLVLTSSSQDDSASLLKFSASNGQLLSEVSRIHRGQCTAITVDSASRHILTAGDHSIKVWDYSMALDLNFQVFVGHSEPISQLLVSPDGRRVVSSAEAIFFWDFLASTPPSRPSPPSSSSSSLSLPPHRNSSMFSVSPRVGPPAPTNFEPLKNHMFTPQPPAASKARQHATLKHLPDDNHLSAEGKEGGRECVCESVTSVEGRESGSSGGGCGVRDKSSEDSSDDGASGEDASCDDRSGRGGDIFIEHSSNEEVHIEVPSHSVQSEPSESSHDQDTPHSVPVVEKHYKPRPPHNSLATHLYVAPPNRVGIERRAVLGMSGRGRGNVIWQASSGLFAYSSGCIVVIEDLSTSHQTHLTGHSEEVSTLAAQGDGAVLASSSHAHNSTPCEIRIWKLPSQKCTKVLTLHAHAVTSMAFSRDDRFLLSLGDHHDNSLAVWSAHDYSLAVATTTSVPCHELAWDPHTAYEFVTVGMAMCVCFWIMEEKGESYKLKVHETEIPADLMQGRKKSEVDFTTACYGPHSKLFIGSSIGVVSMWDTSQNKCIMFWKTNPCEIGVMWYRSGQLAVGDVSGRLAVWGVEGGGGGGGGEKGSPTVSLQKEIKLDSAVFSLAFDHHMKLGVAGTAGGGVWYINWSEESRVKLVCGHAGEVTGAATSSDGQLLGTCSRDGSVAVWNMESLEQTVIFQAPKKECLCIAFAPPPLKTHVAVTLPTNDRGQSPRLQSSRLVAGYSDGSVRIFSKVSGLWTERKMKPHGTPVTKLAFSADGSMLLSGSGDGVVAVSSVSSGLVVRAIQDHRGAIITDLHVAMKPVQLCSGGVEGVWLWLAASGDRRVSVWSADWSQDICHLLDWLSFPGPSCAPNGTKLRPGTKCQYELLPPSLARFSPTDPDTILYTGYGLEKCVQFYSISQKTVLRKFAITHWATCMDISPQGHLIVLGCSERVLKLMDYSEGSFQDFSSHHDSISHAVFSLSGRALISTSDSIVHVWKILH